MIDELAALLGKNSCDLYARSVRSVGGGTSVFVARRDREKLVGLVQERQAVSLPDASGPSDMRLGSGARVTLHPLSWENYTRLREIMLISPSPCDRLSSFGTGDRLGMVTAAHLDACAKCPVFPVLAQQSPRELERTGRDFKGVLLDAVMGVLEAGYTDGFGADADHIKDEGRFIEGLDAGFSMFTLDLSDSLEDVSGLSPGEIADRANGLTGTARRVIGDWSGTRLAAPGGAEHVFSEQELVKSALIYEKAMAKVERSHALAKSRLTEFDLEVSIDEGTRDTTPEDHLFVAEYLHRRGIDFTSLAPKFPGEFQKAIDYIGDRDALARAFNIHAELARKIGGYRLSLHSGSDKFSVYRLFAEATRGHFHIKTSGTSWLQAVRLVAHADRRLFGELHSLCVEALPESKKAYHVFITPEQFPRELPEDVAGFYARPDVQQLFHISYGALLDAKREEILGCLARNEERHYGLVVEHIDRHLKLLFDRWQEEA